MIKNSDFLLGKDFALTEDIIIKNIKIIDILDNTEVGLNEYISLFIDNPVDKAVELLDDFELYYDEVTPYDVFKLYLPKLYDKVLPVFRKFTTISPIILGEKIYFGISRDINTPMYEFDKDTYDMFRYIYRKLFVCGKEPKPVQFGNSYTKHFKIDYLMREDKEDAIEKLKKSEIDMLKKIDYIIFSEYTNFTHKEFLQKSIYFYYSALNVINNRIQHKYDMNVMSNGMCDTSKIDKSIFEWIR